MGRAADGALSQQAPPSYHEKADTFSCARSSILRVSESANVPAGDIRAIDGVRGGEDVDGARGGEDAMGELQPRARQTGRALAMAVRPLADALSRSPHVVVTAARASNSVSIEQDAKAGKSAQRIAYRRSRLARCSGSPGSSHFRLQKWCVPASLRTRWTGSQSQQSDSSAAHCAHTQ